MRKIARSQSVDYASITNSWERVDSCKHFMHGGSLSANGQWRDVKGGLLIDPQTGYEFETDSRGAIRPTTLDTLSSPGVVTGSWSPILATQYCLVLTVGYMYSELSVPSVLPAYYRSLRTAFGDINGAMQSENPTGFGLADGETARASPSVIANQNSHVVFKMNTGVTLSSDDATQTETLGDMVYNAIGTTGLFFRYAITRPDNYTCVSGTHNANTGAAIFTNDRQYGTVNGVTTFAEDVQFPSYFRMHGYWAVGTAMFVFDSLPANYLLGCMQMAKEWGNGNYAIWPYFN